MKIRLVTYQSEGAINQLKSTGVLKITKESEKLTHAGRDNSTNRPFDYGYRFMIYSMREMLPKTDDDITYPIWAWYKMRGKKPPIKRFDKMHKGNYRITFEIDEELVLLSDFDMFCYLLAGGLYFAYNEEEKKELSSHLFDDEVIYYYPNLRRMFDYKHERNDLFTAPYQGMTIQATLWKLTIDQVIEIVKV